MTFQRNLTTAGDRNSDSIAPDPESKPKSTRRKTASSTKTAGKNKKEGKKKAEKKPKVTVNHKSLPPKGPGSAYAQWMRDWISTQPKIESLEEAQSTVKRAAAVWHAVPEHEKQSYREKTHALLAEHQKRIQKWREEVDPTVLREMNRRRLAKGLKRIRGSPRPMTGYIRFLMRVREEHPRTEEDYPTYFKVTAGRASSQWKGMSDAEKAEYNDPAKADLAAWREKHWGESQAKA